MLKVEFPQHVFAVILAGGSGTRFWPKSRQKHPKQLCKIGSIDSSMLSMTLDRLDGYIPPARRIIITHQEQVALTKEDVGQKCHTILSEPFAKNTAPALALGALEINQLNKSNKSPIMISLHADAIIKNPDQFIDALRQAVEVAEDDYLTLLGIKPTYPETGYGYIEISHEQNKQLRSGFLVKGFKEKPELKVAEEYLKSENFFWNSGIFVWRVSVFLNELKAYVPEILNCLTELLGKSPTFLNVKESDLARAYEALPKISIDNAILEKSLRVAMVATRFSWQDVGSWDALSLTFKSDTDSSGNLTYGDVVLIDTNNTTIDTDGPLIATIGLKDMIVVASKGAILVCPKSRAQDVKQIVEQLQKQGKSEYL